MNKKKSKIINSAFAQEILTDLHTFPAMLLREYQQLGLNEQELVILLRIIGHNCQIININDVCEEFCCSKFEAQEIITPFIEKEFLFALESEGKYDACGIFDELYDNWCFHKSSDKTVIKGTKKDVAAKEHARELGHLYVRFEKELGRLLSPIENEKISHWLEKDAMPIELVEEALRRAVLQGKATFAYIDKILLNWKRANLHSLEAVQQYDSHPIPQTKAVKKNTKTDPDQQNDKYSGLYEKILKA